MAITTGNTQAKATSRIFEALSMPNHRMKIGMKAIFGAGKPSATSGSRSQRMRAERAMAMPSATPRRVASASPAKVR